MKAVIQRVAQAGVSIDNTVTGSIQTGLVVLLGIEASDQEQDADWLLHKIIKMRIFADEAGKMNLSLQDVEGEILIISQFTLHAMTHKGNRPSFIKAARPELAIPLYDYFVAQCKICMPHKVQTGTFGADMKISLVNDGPVTIIADSKRDEVL